MPRPQKQKPQTQAQRHDKPKLKKPSAKSKQTTKLMLPSRMTTYTVPPTDWPKGIPYLSAVHQDPSLTQTQLSAFRPLTLPVPTNPAEQRYSISTLCAFSPTTNPLIQIRAITSADHPACGQSGLFTTRALAPGTHILDYTGLLHSCPLPTCSTSDYDLAFLPRDLSLAIDGASMGNEARFVNDYHGVSDKPNAVFEEYFIRVRARGREVWEARMGVWCDPKGEGLGKGEEVLLSYGRGYWRARQALMAQGGTGEENATEGRPADAAVQGAMMDSGEALAVDVGT